MSKLPNHTPKMETVHIDSLSGNQHNVRYVSDGSHLVPSMLDSGLLVPLTISVRPEHKTTPYLVLQGNCRLDALRTIQRESPESFARLFPDGMIPVESYYDLNKQEEAILLVDHDTKGLTKGEVYLAAAALLKAGLSARQVCNRLAMLIDQYWKLSPAQEMALDKIKEEQGIEAYWTEYTKLRMNTMQRFQEVHAAPTFVKDIMRYNNTHELPKWAESHEDIPKLSIKRIKEARDTLKADQKASPNTWTKDHPGPRTMRLLEKWLDEDNSAVGEKRYKALSAKAMMELADNCTSPSIRNIILMCAGRLTVEEADLSATDVVMCQFDVLQSDYATYAEILDEFASIGAEAVEADIQRKRELATQQAESEDE